MTDKNLPEIGPEELIKVMENFMDKFADQLNYPEDIYVRVMRDGKWTNVALAELDGAAATHHIRRWLEQRQVPYRVVHK